MPTYEYTCQKCGHTYEKRQGFDASPRQRCPKCRGTAQRVLYAPPIVFKGSGFYVTDSRKAESGAVGSSSDDKSESATAGDSSSDKPAKSTKSEKSETKESSSSSSEPETAAAG